ncbi:MAG: alpha-glucuronidase family glycosyl hydrolase [Bacteroidales bacterium]|nr:alpha-glucuronidase family glycosyl hydrolase [Bacteroidales bacterium]MDT8431485.1 alpha-glucuronidase family glycosyl hydrolase [Bacteroidales bacterium]
MTRKILIQLLLVIFLFPNARAGNGYDLWLRYPEKEDAAYRQFIIGLFSEVYVSVKTETGRVICEELVLAGKGMTQVPPVFSNQVDRTTSLYIISHPSELPPAFSHMARELQAVGPEGFLVRYIDNQPEKMMLIAGNTPAGALYGTFLLLRELQMGTPPEKISTQQAPAITHRLLNHWDNLDRTVERGYAGFSIWGLAQAARVYRPALYRLCTCERIHRNQRHGAHQCERQCTGVNSPVH